MENSFSVPPMLFYSSYRVLFSSISISRSPEKKENATNAQPQKEANVMEGGHQKSLCTHVVHEKPSKGWARSRVPAVCQGVGATAPCKEVLPAQGSWSLGDGEVALSSTYVILLFFLEASSFVLLHLQISREEDRRTPQRVAREGSPWYERRPPKAVPCPPCPWKAPRGGGCPGLGALASLQGGSARAGAHHGVREMEKLFSVPPMLS